ncbi:MAG: hypothetical protein J6R32_06275 [Bacteroidales bacterium]|nr:hypothetical protein [Bacteroidales bacterium]
MQIVIKSKSNNAAWRKIEEKIKQKMSVKVGWFPQARYKGDDNKNSSVAMVACTQEFGYGKGNIPPRPFMRPAAQNHAEDWAEKFSQDIKTGDLKYALNNLGFMVEGDIRKSISEVWEPPLKRETIYARLRKHGWFNREKFSARQRKNHHKKLDKMVGSQEGIAKPLIDTGYMIASVTHEVEHG